MNNLTYLRSFFILIVGILVITSCLEMNGEEEALSSELSGKWRLVRVEEAVKTVSPPATSPVISIEFTETNTFNGEAMVNSYFGGFNVSGSSLSVNAVGATERGGDASHMVFDDYYFGKLKNAESYYIHENNKTLVIKTKEEYLLIFTRYDNEE